MFNYIKKYYNIRFNIHVLIKKFITNKNIEDVKVPRSKILENLKDKENVLRKQVKASGPGGQHVNKTNSCVYLKDLETNIAVKVSNSRYSEVNNGIARKRLVDKIDLELNGKNSKICKKNEKAKKQKNRNSRRSQEKYNKT